MGWAVSPSDGRVEWDKIVAFCADVRKNIACVQPIMDVLVSPNVSLSYGYSTPTCWSGQTAGCRADRS